jgi:hypothetical protein
MKSSTTPDFWESHRVLRQNLRDRAKLNDAGRPMVRGEIFAGFDEAQDRHCFGHSILLSFRLSVPAKRETDRPRRAKGTAHQRD